MGKFATRFSLCIVAMLLPSQAKVGSWYESVSCTACLTKNFEYTWWQPPHANNGQGRDAEGNDCDMGGISFCPFFTTCTFEANSCEIITSNWHYYEVSNPTLDFTICKNFT